MNRWTRANPLAAVPGYNVPQGHFANGYTNGGDRVGFKSGGRAGFKEGSGKNSERYKKMMKEKEKRKEAREVRDVEGNIISREGRPHSTYEGRGSERRRGYLRKNKMLPGQANDPNRRIQIRPKVSDRMQSLRDNMASVTGGEWGKKSGGRIGLKKGSNKNWIQKAVNPKHKGFCTPMTKKTCTPKRKALARTFKKMGKARKGKG